MAAQPPPVTWGYMDLMSTGKSDAEGSKQLKNESTPTFIYQLRDVLFGSSVQQLSSFKYVQS